ncbi:unnamed protein product [Urochloa decumbens]|uniref:Secreted protein n=1 Tax=Urochloa decumbens TaxID=240449 RepID=A0ABC9DGN2_9POAL
MGIHKVSLALALTMLMVGQLVGGAIVLDERQRTPVLKGRRPAAHRPTKTIPAHGDIRGSGRNVGDDKAFIAPRGYFHPPTLPPCLRKAC